ncbi:hypothetical protein BT69DRAFT_1333701 [Atractiella rhizophila]|nr:hypothetical protein BT69DRAFT_1333701 [Atractiella rhizophila]
MSSFLPRRSTTSPTRPPTALKRQSSLPMSYRNILIIGLGPSSIELIHALKNKLPPTHRIVVVEQNEYAFWPIGSLRAAVVPAWEDRILFPLQSKTPSWLGLPHVLLSGTKAVEVTRTGVRVERYGQTNAVAREMMDSGFDAEFGQWIEWDVLVLATLRSSSLAKCRPTTHPNVSHSSPPPLPSLSPAFDHKPALAASLQRQLQERGIRLLFNEEVDVRGFRTGTVHDKTFTTRAGENIKPDFIFLATGNRPSGSAKELLRTLGNSTKSTAGITPSGKVQVSPSLQLSGVNEAIYAIGDACDTPELKTYANGSRHAPIVAHNILQRISLSSGGTGMGGNRPKEWKEGPIVMAVTIGPKGGSGMVFGVSVGPWMTSKIKGAGLFISDWRKKLGSR